MRFYKNVDILYILSKNIDVRGFRVTIPEISIGAYATNGKHLGLYQSGGKLDAMYKVQMSDTWYRFSVFVTPNNHCNVWLHHRFFECIVARGYIRGKTVAVHSD